MKLSVVIPAFNEEESLPHLLEEIRSVCDGNGITYEVLVIDDGSRDGTFAAVEKAACTDPRVHGIRFRRNCGKAAALYTGFQAARGECIITMDADLQDHPGEIPALLAMLDDGCDLVSGWKEKRHDPWHKTLPSKLFNRVTSMASGLELKDFNCGLKAYKSEVAKSLSLYGELHRYIPVLAHWNGFRVKEKAVEHRARQFGKSKYGWARLTNGMFDLVTLVFLHRYTSRPLHLFGFIGFLFSMLGALILAGFGVNWLLTGAIHVRPLMLGGVAAMIVGLQFVFFGLLGEMMNHRFGVMDYPVARSTPGLALVRPGKAA